MAFFYLSEFGVPLGNDALEVAPGVGEGLHGELAEDPNFS